MLVFPQLSSGATSQFPIKKSRRSRTVVTESQDGCRLKLPDPDANTTEWELAFAGLTGVEASAIDDLFQRAEGRLGSFVFLDPVANLLAWSEQLSEPVWEKDPLMTVSGGIEDPFGTARAYRINNNAPAYSAVAQTLNIPQSYWYSFSCYARGPAGTAVTLFRDSKTGGRVLQSGWSRLTFSSASDEQGDKVRFGIQIPPTIWIELFGLQVEAQPAPSTYKRTMSRGGIYTNARFRDDVLTITALGPDQYSCMVNIIHGDRF